MQVACTLEKKDILSLQRLVHRKMRSSARVRTILILSNIVAWIPIGVFLATAYDLYQDHPALQPDLQFLYEVLLLGVIAIIVQLGYGRKRVLNEIARPDSWIFAEQKIDVNSERLLNITEYGRTVYKWSAFKEVEEDADRLYLFLDNAQAVVIPKIAAETADVVKHIHTWVSSGYSGSE